MIIVRTIQNMSYCSERFWYKENKLSLDINEKSGIYVIIPEEEIQEIIFKAKKYTDIRFFLEEVYNA